MAGNIEIVDITSLRIVGEKAQLEEILAWLDDIQAPVHCYWKTPSPQAMMEWENCYLDYAECED